MAPALADFGKGGGLCSLCWWCLWLGWPPHQAFMAICNVGSHHEDDGVGGTCSCHTLWVIPALRQICTSLERWGASASDAWDLGGPPIMPSWPFAMWGAIMRMMEWGETCSCHTLWVIPALRQICTSLERWGASASGAWDMGGPPSCHHGHLQCGEPS